MEEVDLVVVGAGYAGLAVAKTFHDLHPAKSLAILDAGLTLGGTWAKERLYPGLKTNNMLGTYEYPDFPMDPAVFGVQPGQHIPGHVCHAYLAAYAAKFGIADKIRYASRVLVAEHLHEGGWTLTVSKQQAQAAGTTDDDHDDDHDHDNNNNNNDKDKDKTQTQTQLLRAKKLVVATGLTSEPFRPQIEGEDTYDGLLFHSKDFGQHAATLELDPTSTRVTVFGGTKSAWDTVYAYATKGFHVDWVIRSSGHGPSWMAPAYVTPLKKWLEKLVMTRALTWFSPCAWGAADGYGGVRRLLHGTAAGRAVTNRFWQTLGDDVHALNRFAAHPEVGKLRPWSQAMWVASSFSILNYDTDFFELVRNGTVHVHIADVTALGPRRVHLSDGTRLASDILCCVTGWRTTAPIKFLPEGIEKELGVPRPVPADDDGGDDDNDDDDDMHDLLQKADEEILSTWPRLRDPPVQNANLVPLVEQKGIDTDNDNNNNNNNNTQQRLAARGKLSAWTLYRFMVPPSRTFLQTRDIAFAGMLMNFNVPITCHFQALWINAFFFASAAASSSSSSSSSSSEKGLQGLPQLTTGPRDEAKEEEAEALDKLRYTTVLHARFGKWRYPAGHGDQYPDFVFDALPYIDLLAADLGLRVHRKRGMMAEIMEPYGPEDYRTVVDEWKEKNAVAVGEGKK